MHKLIGIYFNLLSLLSPKMAANQSFELFQKTFKKNKRFRKKELEFYKSSSRFITPWGTEDLQCYEMGNPDNDMVVLVHGWNSNAGSMYAIGQALVKSGHYVVTFDLPAHGHSRLNKTNLVMCSSAFNAFIHRLLPVKSFSIVSHSFGSLVVSHALAGSRFKIDKWVMLTSPNKVTDIFTAFGEQIGLRKKAYDRLVNKAEELLQERIDDVSVAIKIQQVNYNKLLIMHDRFDRVLPFSNSLVINKTAGNSRLEVLENTGHYKMLSNNYVIDELLGIFAQDILEKKYVKPKELMLN